MGYGTVLMLQNQSNVLTIYEIPSPLSSVVPFQGTQTTQNVLGVTTNVNLTLGEVALIHEYAVSGFSNQNFLYQQVNLPNLYSYTNSTIINYTSATVSVKPNHGYQIQLSPNNLEYATEYQFVDSVESTSWEVPPYWQNGTLVINSTRASNAGQYIAWYYTPTSNTITIFINITSFPLRYGNPGIVVYSPNVGSQTTDGNNGFYALLVDFYGNSIYFHSPTSNWEQLYSSLPQPNPNYPFTFTVVLTKNSAGNITVSTIYINSTAYAVNVNTPFPWSQVGYIGIRGDINNLFYVSKFGASYQYVNNAESVCWKEPPYWKNGELVINATSINAGQYILWRYVPLNDIINITVHITNYPNYGSNRVGIYISSSNLASNNAYPMYGNYYLGVYWSGFYSYNTPNYFTWGIYNSPIPNLLGKVFTETIILTKNSNGNITISQIYVNGTLYSSPNISTPFPWNEIAYIGIASESGNIFYVSYFSVSSSTSSVVEYEINSVLLPPTSVNYGVTVLISQFSNGSYAILGMNNGSWYELNLPIPNPNGIFKITMYNAAGQVKVAVSSSNVLSYGALFILGNGVMLDAEDTTMPPSPRGSYAALAYIGENGQVGGGIGGMNYQFTPVTSNSVNYYEGVTIVQNFPWDDDWGTTNFTYYSVSFGQFEQTNLNYAIVGTGFTANTIATNLQYYPFSGFIDMVYIENNTVATKQTPPSISSLLFFFDPTYINQQGQYINPFTNQTYQEVGSLNREVQDIGVIKFLDPNVTDPEIFIPPFTEVAIKSSNYSQTFINYDTFPYKIVTVPPGQYQITIVLVLTAYSFVLINWQGWNVTVYENGQPMIINDPMTQQIQPFTTQGLLSAQVVADPNKKVLTIYLEPLSSGVGIYSPKLITFPKPAPELILPLTQSTPFSLSTLTVSGIVTVAMVLGVVIALARANQDLLGSIAAGGAVAAVIGVIIHLMPIIFIGSVLFIISTAYRFARRNSQ
ncbi:hypothetical protein AVT97_gp19 [Sulfolobales Virus YNP2]|uniref:hypothetical protein n=1 Tax=Sulfolobales Virus YNP2 TaxID=1732180 RepID=UPI000706DFC0|nr:hypothetical protein AVT97_gp19 [Sulfolobales Virus YNP2]ALG97182.1 hypothetical protein [Sulfolobales Virus YNP2]